MTLSDFNIKALQYLVDHELDDFNTYPSNEHVYYCAYATLYGEKNAEIELNNAIKFINQLKEA